jgi:hypothetical protein
VDCVDPRHRIKTNVRFLQRKCLSREGLNMMSSNMLMFLVAAGGIHLQDNLSYR